MIDKINWQSIQYVSLIWNFYMQDERDKYFFGECYLIWKSKGKEESQQNIKF